MYSPQLQLAFRSNMWLFCRVSANVRRASPCGWNEKARSLPCRCGFFFKYFERAHFECRPPCARFSSDWNWRKGRALKSLAAASQQPPEFVPLDHYLWANLCASAQRTVREWPDIRIRWRKNLPFKPNPAKHRILGRFISRNNPTKNKGLIVERAQTKGNGTVLTKNQGR